MKGSERNRPCPCGSGEKAKRCASCTRNRAHAEAIEEDRLREEWLTYRRTDGLPIAARIAALVGVLT